MRNTIFILAIAVMFGCKADVKKEIAQTNAIVEKPTLKQHSIKVALLLDTSNSMDGLIDQAKAQLWEIVNELSYAKCLNERPTLAIGLYEYGNDKLSSQSGYTRKILGFTNDLDEVSKELFSLTTNGGSEYCGTVINAAIQDLDWGNDADDLKMIFIAGNEPFTQGNIDYKDIAHQAKEKEIVVNTIFCGKYQHGVDTQWKDGAARTYGDYLAIDQNKETIHIASPYDDFILQLNIQLNNTYVPYGRKGSAKIAVQAEQDMNANGYSKANAVSRAVTKGSHLYKNSSWDLVDAEKEADFSYAEIKKEQLPKELKGKSISEIKLHVSKKRKEREIIKSEIDSYNKKRQKYLNSKSSTTDENLGNAMVKAIKRQANKKNYVWE